MQDRRHQFRTGAIIMGAVVGLGSLAWARTIALPGGTIGDITVVPGASAGRTPAILLKPKAVVPPVVVPPAVVPPVVIPEPEPYVLGTMTWTLAGGGPQQKLDQITDSMNWTINQINTLTDYSGNVRAVYDAWTPTAAASFLGQMKFGGSTNRRTALHEMNHWLGSGTVPAFSRRVSGGTFNGYITGLRIRGYDGDTARLNSDGTHFWPYGMNYDNEFAEPQRTIGLVAAQRADLGWGDGTYAIVGNRRFQNRASRLILDAGSGSAAVQQPNGTAATQTWKTGYIDGFVTLTDSKSSLALDSLGVTADGGTTAMRPASPSQRTQHWEMIPTDNGWFLLRNRATRKCLDNVGNQGGGATMRVWGCSGHPNQQWHLVR